LNDGQISKIPEKLLKLTLGFVAGEAFGKGNVHSSFEGAIENTFHLGATSGSSRAACNALWTEADIGYRSDYLGEALQYFLESSILFYQINENSPVTVVHTPCDSILCQDIAESVIMSTVLYRLCILTELSVTVLEIDICY
jgi:hypothetical protein